jgi:recombinational DNA repair protein (RecF pathway)
MYEHVSQALVLARYPHGEADLRISLFTRDIGRLVATAISGRKITSKLSPHLQEGSVVSVRLIEQKGIRVADALTVKPGVRTLEECLLLDRLIPENVPEPEVWRISTASRVDWDAVLASLGWDPGQGTCSACEKKPAVFVVRSQEFLCAEHAPHAAGSGEVVPLRGHVRT